MTYGVCLFLCYIRSIYPQFLNCPNVTQSFNTLKVSLNFVLEAVSLGWTEIFLVCVPFPKPGGWSFAAHWSLSLQQSHVPKFWSILFLTSPSARTLTALMMMMMMMMMVMMMIHHHHFMVIIIIIIFMIIIIVDNQELRDGFMNMWYHIIFRLKIPRK